MALVWCAGVYAIDLANGREVGSGDSVPAKYLELAPWCVETASTWIVMSVMC